MRQPIHRPALLLSLLALLALPALLAAPAAGQTVLLEDGGFADWSTRSSFEDREASGSVDPAVGTPPPSYRIEHEHIGGGPFGPFAVSRTLYEGTTYDFSSYSPDDRLELALDLCLEELGDTGIVAVFVQPLLLQGGTLLRPPSAGASQIEVPDCGAQDFQRRRITTQLRDFLDARGQGIDPRGARVQLGFLVQTTIPTQTRALVRVDDVKVTHFPALAPGVQLDVSDRDVGWDPEGVAPILYRITVANSGPPQRDLVLEVTVPARTCLSEQSVLGDWDCGPGGPCSVGRTARCTLPLGNLGREAQRSVDVAVSIGAGVPSDWEVFMEVSLFSGSDLLATDTEITLPVSELAGPGCLCIFFPDLCGV